MVRVSADETWRHIDETVRASAEETRRYVDVVGEAIRNDVRLVAESVVMLAEKVDRNHAEVLERIDRLDQRLLNLEVRVGRLESR